MCVVKGRQFLGMFDVNIRRYSSQRSSGLAVYWFRHSFLSLCTSVCLLKSCSCIITSFSILDLQLNYFIHVLTMDRGGSPYTFRGFFNMPVQALTLGQPFNGYFEKPPHFSRLLRRTWGYEGFILVLRHGNLTVM